ncbi:lipopolysaccharide biosynthesis protein [Sphingomonas sp. CLY1604]|uniref:lipopolysaccharide biosynthesis protein n=1 Tax=Sphingomonas sp. CLY1604 TaxID=3457786 RepID=UPI003FD6E419
MRTRHGGSLVTTATRLIDIPCRYGMHLMIALRLPLDQVGAFYIVFGTMSLASGLGRLGVDRALTREMARALAHGDSASARAALWRALALVLALSVGLAILTAALAWPIARHVMDKPAMTPLFLIGALSIIPLNLSSLTAGALAGLHRVTESQIVYTWLWPGLFCVIAFLLPLDVALALLAIAGAMALAAVIGTAMLFHHLPARPAVRGTAAPLLSIGLSLFSVELVQLLISAAPPFVLGALSTTDAVGLYAIAWRVVLVIYMFVSGVASLVSPRFARLYMLHDHAGLRREARRALGFALALALLPIALVTIEPTRILMLFGAHFAPAASTLRILLIGQLAAALTTTTPELLGMTGYARALLRLNALALVTLLAGLVGFVPSLGADGAGIATAATMLVNAIGGSIVAQRRLGFTPIGELYAALSRRRSAMA